MRTTLDIDDALFQAAAQNYPPGTPKTVIVEEGLRRLVRPTPRFATSVEQWVAEGVMRTPQVDRPLPPIAAGRRQPLGDVLAELDEDRGDR